jgi:antitoxin component YwqK of YwqJK toxin-antitoxin module
VLYVQGEYVKDKKENGVFKEYFDDEQLKSETTYRKGVREGRHVEYHDNGRWVDRPLKVGPEGFGKAETERVLEGQTVKLECSYKADQLDGDLKEYDERGALVRHEVYAAGQQVNKLR